jgi:hypothetical protein
MSNPLLQPNDRFRRPDLVDPEGRNRFAESQEALEAKEAGDMLASPGEHDTYQPRYTAALPHRGRFIATLGAVGFCASWLLVLSFTSWVLLGVAASLFGIVLSIAAAVLVFRDLKVMSLGAVDPTGRDATLLGFRLALAGIFLGGGAALCVIWLLVRGVLDLGIW